MVTFEAPARCFLANMASCIRSVVYTQASPPPAPLSALGQPALGLEPRAPWPFDHP